MKGILLTSFCLLLLVTGAAGQQQDGPLTNVSVVKLVKAGFKEKTIITIINSRPANYKLDTEDLIELKRNGVNESIILAMLSAQMGTVFLSDDEWSGDPFFKDSRKQNGGNSQSQGAEGIFGSGSSSQSSSRSRGGLGGNQDDSNLSGSATVRIIKPPTEGGQNGAPKLEKTPTLTNEGVIRLVEAGFSEGTIIKRIEESPVEFDLSPAKLDELFKRRVTDAIIAAMRAAMGDK
ncbi:MAG TPA: hypothetical protein VGQ41_25775 [Pyrinomonadaceae bacterium]|jgi:hypothetical protein|nr:hypothetical protein [Pyrinomonadaceae bacterium]